MENDRDIAKLCDFVRGEGPDRIELVVRLGRITALQKPDGGVHGIVVSDFLVRAVARTIFQQVSKEVVEATAPFQHALKTKSGCECVSHILQTLTQSSPRCTIVSVVGVSVFDLVSRNAMLRGLMSLPSGGRLLPFVRTFHGQPCGRTRLVRFTTFNKVRAANRGILSCPFCPALPNTLL